MSLSVLQARKEEYGRAFLPLSTETDILHALYPLEVFCVLVDCHRLRLHDEFMLKGPRLGIYDNKDASYEEFSNFIDLAESREGLLPSWWTPKNSRKRSMRLECDTFAMQEMRGWYQYVGHADGNIFRPACDIGIRCHYGDDEMPKKLRALGCVIYGSAVQ